jgi:hypothetical protein
MGRRISLDPKPPSEKLTKIGEKVVSHSRYVAFQMAEATTYFTGIGRSWVPDLRRLFQFGRTRRARDQVV